MVKGLFSSAVIVIALMVSGAVHAQNYPSEKEFYPAVYGAIAQLYPDAKYLDIDFYNNSYTLTGVTGISLLSHYSYNLTLRLQDNGEIDAEYSNIYSRVTDKSGKVKWERKTSFLLYNYKNALADLKSKILSIVNNETAYNRYKQEAMSDVEFLYPVVQNFTAIAFKDFAKNYLADSLLTVRGRVSDVKEYGKEVNGITYKYFVTLSQNLINKSDSTKNSKVYLPTLANRYLVCTVYTNSDNVVRMSKTAIVTINGKVIKAERNTSNKTSGLSLYLVEE